jgi:hypothetical protein
MFWEHEDWSLLDAGELADALATIRAGLPAHDRDAFELHDAPDDSHALDDGHLQVRSIRVRRLRFYADHWLYELGLSPEATGLASRYESARAFVVLSPSDASEAPPPQVGAPQPPHRRPALATRDAAVSAVLLDWTAGVIFQLNERGRMRLAPDGRFDRQLALDYLDFFVSFIASDNSREPFLLLHGGTLAQPAGIPRRRASLPAFEQAIGEQLLDGKPFERPRRYAYIPENPSATDEPDLRCIDSPTDSDRASHQAGGAEASGVASTAPTSPDPAGSGRPAFDPAAIVIDGVHVSEEDPERTALGFTAALLYENTIFKALFEISCEPNQAAQIRMLGDEPLVAADPALLQYQVDRLDARGIRLLLLLKPRAEVAAAEFLAQLRRAAATNALSPAAWVENLRVTGDVNFQLLGASGPVRVRDVEFMGRVVLDECRRDASVVFERCRFARSLDARNASIDGDLVLRGSTVLGVVAQGDPLYPSICLAGLRLTGDLDGQQLAVDGEFNAPNADITGRGNLRGIDLRLRRGSEQFGMSMRNAAVKAGLDLSPYVGRDAVGQKIARSRVEGTIDLVGLHALEVDLRGAACAALDLSYAQLEGLLNLSAFDPALDSIGAMGNRLMRAIVYGYVDLRCARVREVFLSGANIAGELMMVGTEIERNLFAQPNGPLGYRCRIGGSATLSSARIQGDADFDGAQIAGNFEMRTGSLGRLFMSMCPVVLACGDSLRLDYFQAEVGRVEVIGVTGLGSIGLAGILVRGHRNDLAAVLIEHVESRGDIRFYWGLRERTMFANARAVAHEQLKAQARRRAAANDPDAAAMPTEPGVQREASARTCSATVVGSIEMRRIITGGHIDLTNLKVVGGSVRLNDARIGTDLFARRSWLRGKDFLVGKDRCADPAAREEAPCSLALECSGLDLDNAHVEGDAFLSGVELRADEDGDGRFRGRGLVVGGLLEFFGGAACMARIEGGIDLAGASAAHLSLPGVSALCAPPASGTSALHATQGRVVLERCRLGKLHIDHPIPRLDLTGIQVANWKLGTPGPHGEANDVDSKIAILSQMDPMDRSVWIGVESELRNEARVREADRVYREMKHREPVGALRAIPKFFSRWLYGYGTRVAPAVALWLLLSLALFAMLRQPDNVKVSDNVLLQLGGQCRTVQERAATAGGAAIGRGAVGSAAAAPANTLPAKCATYFAAIDGTTAPSIEITAAQLVAAGAQSGYDFGDAMLLSLRYAIPFIGAFGDPDWVPAEQPPARIGTAAAVPVDVGLAPSILAAVVLLVNSLLLSFAAAFVAKRWLR